MRSAKQTTQQEDQSLSREAPTVSMHVQADERAGCAGAHAGCSEDTDMPSALPDIGQSLFDDEDCLLSVDLPLGALARCAALRQIQYSNRAWDS